MPAGSAVAALRNGVLSPAYNWLSPGRRKAHAMLPNRIIPADCKVHALPKPQRGTRDRRFETLYLNSFVEMRARSAKA